MEENLFYLPGSLLVVLSEHLLITIALHRPYDDKSTQITAAGAKTCPLDLPVYAYLEVIQNHLTEKRMNFSFDFIIF